MSAPKLAPHKVEQHEGKSRTEHYNVSTMAQALALAKRASRHYAHVSMSAYLHSTDAQYKPGYYRACAELSASAMVRFIEHTLEHMAVDADEYVQVRLYTFYLPGRYNPATHKEGAPRRRTSFYIG